MRILHAPTNSAGQAYLISRAQRKLGAESDVLVFYQTHFQYGCDINLDLQSKPRLIKYWTLLKNFFYCLKKYDVFHFHFGQTLLPYFIDLPILKFFKKKIYMQYWGYDCMQTDLARKYTLIPEEELNRIKDSISDEKKRKNLKVFDKYANKTIVGGYSLLPYTKESAVIPQAYEVKKVQYIGCKPHEGATRIVHAPTSRIIKGTEFIVKAIDSLKKAGYNIDLIMVEKKSNEEALEIYKKADIVVDEVMQGPYGMLAIECMAMGKPVLCRVDQAFKDYYDKLDLPIVNTDPTTVEKNLKDLLDHPEKREVIGKAGRRYVEQVHDDQKIAQELIDLYKNT